MVIFFTVFCTCAYADSYPDFTVSDIKVLGDKFIYLKLENQSIHDCIIKPEYIEKIFLTIYINDLKRAEYKLKYIDKKLLTKNSKILFRTNFRAPYRIKIKAEINMQKIIPELNLSNNILEKKLTPNE